MGVFEYDKLQTLLDLDGLVFWLDAKHWVKFSAKKVEPTAWIPHGIRYSLTLHDSNNTRVFGFDNAHAIKAKKRSKFAGRIVKWDHVHKFNRVFHYEFESPDQLLTDFWNAVDKIVAKKD